jgi:TonB family protein
MPLSVIETRTEKINLRAAAWTIGVHALLLLLFVWIGFSIPATLPAAEEGGFEVNIGTDPDGSGNDQALSIESPAMTRIHSVSRPAAPAGSEHKELLESGQEDAPTINQPVSEGRNPNPTNTTNNRNMRADNRQADNVRATRQPQQHGRFEYAGATGNSGNDARINRTGSSEGNTTGNGDRGVAGGTEGAANYTGTPGNGNGGIAYNVKGRTIVRYPGREADYGKGGTVMVRVTVNRVGIVTDASVKTSSNSALNNIARQKALDIRFSQSSTAAPEQFGEITFKFTTVR